MHRQSPIAIGRVLVVALIMEPRLLFVNDAWPQLGGCLKKAAPAKWGRQSRNAGFGLYVAPGVARRLAATSLGCRFDPSQPDAAQLSDESPQYGKLDSRFQSLNRVDHSHSTAAQPER